MDNYPQTHSTCASWIARQSNQSTMMKMTWLVLFCSAPKQTSRSMDSRIVTSVILCLACLGTCQSSSFQCALVQWTVMVIPYDSEGNELGWVINQISSWERLEDNRRESNLIFPPRMAVGEGIYSRREGENGARYRSHHHKQQVRKSTKKQRIGNNFIGWLNISIIRFHEQFQGVVGTWMRPTTSTTQTTCTSYGA